MKLVSKFSIDNEEVNCDTYIFKTLENKELVIIVNFIEETVQGAFYVDSKFINIATKESKGILAALPETERLRAYDDLVWG